MLKPFDARVIVKKPERGSLTKALKIKKILDLKIRNLIFKNSVFGIY